MKRYWLYVWLPRSKVRNGWDFDTQKEAEEYYTRHFRDENLEMEIIYEV